MLPRCPSCGRSSYSLVGCSTKIVGSAVQQSSTHQCTKCGVSIKVDNGVLVMPATFQSRARLGLVRV